MKKTFFLTLLTVFLTNTSAMAGWFDIHQPQNNADQIQAEATKRSLEEANRQIGMPAIKNFQERKLAKMIFELRDQEKLITYAYIVNHMKGELVFIGICIGFGLPYSVQYTNPERIYDLETEGGARNKFEDNGEIQVIPQADPNGLFMPTGLSATWLMMIDPRTKEARPVYIEPEIIVSPFPLTDNTPRVDIPAQGQVGSNQ